MNAKNIIAAIALVSAAGAAFAEAPYPPENQFVSTKTRAEVVTELKQAQQQGQIVSDANYPAAQQPHSSLSRAEVVAHINQREVSADYHGA